MKNQKSNTTRRIVSPVIVIGAPRSGTTILRHCLAQHPRLWHLRAESHNVLEGPIHPAPEFESNRCTSSDVGKEDVIGLRREFYRRSLNLNVLFDDASPFFRGRSLLQRTILRFAVPAVGAFTKLYKDAPIRLLEKTPKNSLRVSLMHRLFPDAYFVWNKRKPQENIDSLIDGWRTTDSLGPIKRPRFATYDVAGELNLQDYEGTAWKFALVPEWRSLRGERLADVAAWQYYQCNRLALDDFQSIDSEQIFEVKHEEFVREPFPIVQDILDWADLSPAHSVDRYAAALPQVNDTRTAQRGRAMGLRFPSEVRRAIEALPELHGLAERMGYTSVHA